MSITRFDYPSTRSIRFGTGAADDLAEALAELDIGRALLITTNSLINTSGLDRLITQAGTRIAGIFSNSKQHLPAEMINPLLAQAQLLQPDGIVTLGGGTVTDAGKAVAAALATDSHSLAELHEYRVRFSYPDSVEMEPIDARFVPQVAIPTTLSAAEYDGVFGMTRDATKDLYINLQLAPAVVLLDPLMTLTTPQWLWASTGVRALDHAVETYLSRSPTAITDACAIQAIKMLTERLHESMSQEALDARLDCLVAGWLSMMGVHNVFLGLSHGIGHQLGARCGVPHGQTSCIMLPVVLERLEAAIPARMAQLSYQLGLASVTETRESDAATALTIFVRELIASLEVPTRLSEVGVSRDHFEALARDAMSDLVVAFAPVNVDELEVISILERAL